MTDELPALSVVVPVFNQAEAIVGNLNVIRERIAAELDRTFEIIVVSDGSIDATEKELVASAPSGAFRVFHYDRNLGKGYAVKLGALEARGDWVAFIDADLDLDPALLASYVRRAELEELDFAIGSKRHPDSVVQYPRSRVAASWLFQQLVRVLFRLNVRDTQVGMKVFRREVADQVLPFLLVKRYAFDIELLAVARAFGFERIGEMPIKLDYRFTGSGVRSRAVLRALVDTSAIFYRLRILRYYQRRRRLAGTYGFTRPRISLPSVSVLQAKDAEVHERDFDTVDTIEVAEADPAGYRAAAERAKGEVLAILQPGVRPASNWLSATVPFLSRPEVGAVVTPKVAPLTGGLRQRGAAAVVESRAGTGLGYFRYTPGNVRYVRDFPASAIVIRRETLLALPSETAFRWLAAAVAASGASVLYTPEAVVVSDPPPLFKPHLTDVFARGRVRGLWVRRRGLRALPRRASVVLIAVVVLFVLAWALDASTAALAAYAVIALYMLAVLSAAAVATLRFQSLAVGVVAFAGMVATHVVYVAGLSYGLAAG